MVENHFDVVSLFKPQERPAAAAAAPVPVKNDESFDASPAPSPKTTQQPAVRAGPQVAKAVTASAAPQSPDMAAARLKNAILVANALRHIAD